VTGVRYKVWDGATSDSYQATQKPKCLGWRVKLIYIKNNHGSNSIAYKIYGEADSRDTADSTHLLLGETTLAAGGTAIYRTEDPWDSVYVSVKNASAGSDASAVIWINGGE